jgi:UDP-N-acetylglucosamine--N-acetylmuramyl-(pentapeptide) pyrophosphoryl-undecaprenol N-acetylglucosamine transferase
MLVGVGAARLVEDANATPEALDPIVSGILGDADARAHMADAARSVGRPDAARAMAAWIMSLSEARGA